jgi:Photosynthetic reaction centre cytochrome C subunit
LIIFNNFGFKSVVMKKSLLIIIGCITSIILFQAFTITQEPHFKNLQILPKDISDHDLDSVMHHFSASLGVKCNFCHVVDTVAKKMDAASDDKPEKNMARKMMLMAIDINKNYFKNMEQHDMDHDQDMNKNMAHDSAMAHDMDKNQEHSMDTSIVMEPSKYMLRSITCYTCHRGDPHPETKPPPRKEGAPPAPAKTADKK